VLFPLPLKQTSTPLADIFGDILCPDVQSFRDVHKQPAEEEQSAERQTHDYSERAPIVLCRECVLKVVDLSREIAGQETYWQEEHAEFC